LEYLVVHGGKRLSGEITVEGAKNSVLPVMAAALLSGDKGGVRINSVPRLFDVEIMISILKHLGVKVKEQGEPVQLDASGLQDYSVPENLMGRMRSSIFLMGPLLGKMGRARVSHPGGCSIGVRPIDLHLKGLQKMGIQITEEAGSIEAKGFPRGAEIHLDYPSVGATENLLMAASTARGKTVINNAAKEPEIVDLQNFLNSLGGRISGAGTGSIRVKGVEALGGGSYEVIPDRIAAGTYLLAAAATGGEVLLKNVIPCHLEAVCAKLREAGVELEAGDDSIYLKRKKLNPLEVNTLPYPGFPTDLQPPMLSLLTQAEGRSTVKENVFESRFKHVDELNKMGAAIEKEGRSVIIRGKARLTGAMVEAGDLRAGAALVIAGLVAEGRTVVYGLSHLDRGYENLEGKLNQLNASIERCVKADASSYRQKSS